MVKKTDDLQDEYQYSEEEYTEQVVPEPEAKPAKPGMFALFKTKRILIPIIIVAAIFILAQFIGRSKQQVDAEQPKSASTAFQQQPNNIASQINAAATAATAAQERTEVVGIKEQQDRQGAQLEQLAQELQQIKASVEQIQSVLLNFNTMIDEMNRKLKTAATAPKAEPKRPIMQVPVRHKPRTAYRLTAVMPGRAWLESSRGTTITIKVGDTVPGYGTVVKISAPEGVVVTSDGKVITYGKNDS